MFEQVSVSIGYYEQAIVCWVCSFSSSLLHESWGLNLEIPIFTTLYHSLCVVKNAQKQPFVSVLQKKCYSKFFKIYSKSLAPEPFLKKLGLQP